MNSSQHLLVILPSLLLCMLLGGCSDGGSPGGPEAGSGQPDSAAPADDEVATGATSNSDSPHDDDEPQTGGDSADGKDDSNQDEDDSNQDEGSSPGPQSLAELCFPEIFDANTPGPDYEQFAPIPGSHCLGTDHQDISGVERVVFVGDSVTVGSPPTLSAEFYRSRLTEALATEFNLGVPGLPWPAYDPLNGVALGPFLGSGDFASCAEWGARADDLMRDDDQLLNCLPEPERSKRTLVIMTMGGNDIAALTRDGSAGASTAELWLRVEQWVADIEEAVQWIKAPGRFPNGVFVIFANNYEFTDATGDVASCPAAGLGGFEGDSWEDPTAQEDMIVWAMEQYMRIAVETGSDMIWMLEHFCGHGYRRDDPNARCYRGPDTELWFDLTCVHPNPVGHQVIADMFMAVVQE